MVQWFVVAAMTGAFAWFAVIAPASAQTCAAPGNVSSTCSGNCAQITAPMVSGGKGGTVNIPLNFNQGPDDGQGGQGFDEVAAIAFTLGAPGTGDAAPLRFDCTDGNLNSDAVTVGAGIASDFTVVVENAQCTNRNRCLCADTGAGQTRDNFVNIVVYGPKTLPEQGPVNIPKLPPSGTLATLKMRIAADAPATIPLHVFSALDSAKPQFAANLSIGDQAACDVSANAQNHSNVAFVDGNVTVGPPMCVGDCNSSGDVQINELVIGVNIALGSADLSACPSYDVNNNGQVDINELVLAVNNALNGC
jgi:prepilin-type processing-associated H-X9-DG protein